jgi:hypothetical protein
MFVYLLIEVFHEFDKRRDMFSRQDHELEGNGIALAVTLMSARRIISLGKTWRNQSDV